MMPRHKSPDGQQMSLLLTSDFRNIIGNIQSITYFFTVSSEGDLIYEAEKQYPNEKRFYYGGVIFVRDAGCGIVPAAE